LKSLEDILRAKAKSGDLNHVSLAFTNAGTWEAVYRGTLHNAHQRAESSDPVDALMSVLTGRKPAPVIKPAPVKQRKAKVPEPVIEQDLLFGDLM
jgi:hypothetical protein